MEETEARIVAFSVSKPAPDLDKHRAELEKLSAAARAVRLTCTDVVRTGACARAWFCPLVSDSFRLHTPHSTPCPVPTHRDSTLHIPHHAMSAHTGVYAVRTSEFKELLASKAEELQHLLLDQIRADVRASNVAINEAYLVIQTEVAKVSHTSEDVIALKKYIQKSNSDMERLRDDIATNRERDAFLVEHRFDLPEEDFEVSVQGAHSETWFLHDHSFELPEEDFEVR